MNAAAKDYLDFSSVVSQSVRLNSPPLPSIMRPVLKLHGAANKIRQSHETCLKYGEDSLLWRTPDIRKELFGGEMQGVCRRIRRYMSEDSGISSCGSGSCSRGSSVSSIGEEAAGVGTAGGARRLGSLSGSKTVAAVLAAGAASDSEGTDIDSSDCSDEEIDDVFERAMPHRGRQVTGEGVAVRHLIAVRRIWPETGQVKAYYSGRDFLDLGSNLKTHFPLQASYLPQSNPPMYLRNRSQYHRLGKFGTSENFHMVKCVKGCGFAFPVPVLD